jgi:hypothetical protein
MDDSSRQENPGKAFATARARAALAGWTLERAPDGDGVHYVAARWGRSHTLATLVELEALLDQVAPLTKQLMERSG